MKKLYKVSVDVEAETQQQAEHKINQVMDIAAGHKPVTLLQTLCVFGIGYLETLRQERERQQKLDELAMKNRFAKRKMRAKRDRKAAKT